MEQSCEQNESTNVDKTKTSRIGRFAKRNYRKRSDSQSSQSSAEQSNDSASVNHNKEVNFIDYIFIAFFRC